MSEIDTFRSSSELEKEIAALKRENNAAMLTIQKLLQDLSKKNEKIGHLENLISQTVPVVQPETKKVKASVSPEEEIAAYQLERLRVVASQRALTLEETRAYDILVKNKRLSQDESTLNLSKGSYRDVTDTELIQIAAQSQVTNDDSDPS